MLIQSVNPHFFVTLYYNGSPYICATFNKLLGILQVGEDGISILLFIAQVSNDECDKITMNSCSKCNNYRIENDGEMVEICHLCHLLECEPNRVYICRHFKRQFDFTLGDESSVAHINITMSGGDNQYFFYKTHNCHNGKDIVVLRQEALINLETFLEERLSKCDRH